MVKKTVTVTTCDYCDQELPTERFQIRFKPKRGQSSAREVDLCEKHASPLHDILARVGRRRAPQQALSALPRLDK